MTYTKGWLEWRKRTGKIIDNCYKEREHRDGKQGICTNKQSRPKEGNTKIMDLQPSPKRQRDVYSQSASKDFRFTGLVVQNHEVAVRVPMYVVSESTQLEEEEQDS